jgi:hypothetical protein
MTLYTVALFLHVAGALGLFATLALDWVALTNLRRATDVAQVREWASLFRTVRVLGPASLAALLVFGLYMTATTWGPTAWIGLGIVGLILIGALGATSGIRIARLLDRTDRGIIEELRAPIFANSIRMRTALALWIVFLMTAKTDLVTSLGVLAIATLAGIAVSVRASRGVQRREVAA